MVRGAARAAPGLGTGARRHVGHGVSRHVNTLVVRAGVAEVGAWHGSGAAPAIRRRVSQPADEHVAMCDGFEHGTERVVGHSSIREGRVVARCSLNRDNANLFRHNNVEHAANRLVVG